MILILNTGFDVDVHLRYTVISHYHQNATSPRLVPDGDLAHGAVSLLGKE